MIDFTELIYLVRDLFQMGIGQLSPEAFATQVWLGVRLIFLLLYPRIKFTQLSFDEGQLNLDKLKENIRSIVLNADKKDPAALKVLLSCLLCLCSQDYNLGQD